jgi:amidohydrolase
MVVAPPLAGIQNSAYSSVSGIFLSSPLAQDAPVAASPASMEDPLNEEDLKRAACQEAEGLREEMVTLSREIFADPELSGQEHRSVERISSVLERHGGAVESGIGGLPTAFRATFPGASPRPRVAFLAEYDALPEVGHGCGHNLIGTAGAFAGIVASRLAARSRGSVTVIGTPAEETVGGKVVLAERGVFDGYDAAIMVHPAGEDRVNSTSLACSGLQVEFLGKAAHAVAHPEKGINALDAMIQLFIALAAARSRWSTEAKVPGVILQGGVRANIVPERAVGQFTIRAGDIHKVRAMREDMQRMIEGISRATGARFQITPTDHPYFEMVTNAKLASAYRANLKALGRTTVEGPRVNQGSLDMGNVSYRCPSIHPFVAICGPEIASHTRDFGEASISPVGERALLDSVKAMAMTAVDLFSWRHLVQEAREEFDSVRAPVEDSGARA